MRIFNITFNHLKLYYFGLILTAICLPVSKFALSISMIFLISNWILEWDFKRKLKEIIANKSILIFTGIFLIHLLWLINTSNFKYAFHDLGNKAIILLFPIIIGTSQKLSIQQIKKILMWFSLAVVVSTIISTLILVGVIGYPIQSIRNISAFMSHIRLSLLINISIFSLGYILFSKKIKNTKLEFVTYFIFIVWLIVFLYLLKSFTGISIFFVTLFLVLGFVSFKIQDIVPKLFLQVSLITIFLLIASFLTHSVSKFYSKENVDFENLENYTQSGNLYEHFKEEGQLENGNYVWIYVCQKELENEWNKLSSISYKGEDQKGQKTKYMLIRYLTSKGYRKDSVGISKLSSKDIKNIENGMANYIYENKYAIYPKIYEAIWQIDVYRKGFNPAGNSITQRVEFVKTAFYIIKDNFWFGVGTGDVQDSFDRQYELNNSQLPKENRLRAHNQYITFFLTFGFIGFILLFFSMLYPVFNHKGFYNYLFMIFFIIALLSFINEDTLETQIGITFFSYFYSLFLFGSKIN
ncbi:MAG: O-antigen ligase family protein, partial [Bacteroidales bacterium]|nr:O-antigen ligase family protein [Bacteroidales bacterium]